MSVDFDKLRNLNPAAEAIFYGLSALRQRNKARSNVLLLRQQLRREGFVFSDKDYITAWYAFEKAGLCKLVMGPKTIHADWLTRLTDLGHLGVGVTKAAPVPQSKPKVKKHITLKKPVVIIPAESGLSEQSIKNIRDAIEAEYAGKSA